MDVPTASLIFIFGFSCYYINSSFGMGYGTILSPLFLILGYDPLIIIPSILISQAIGGLSAAFFHRKFGNVKITLHSDDSKIASIIILAGIIAAILTVFIAVNIDIVYIKTYIGLLVLLMGIVLLSNKIFVFTWKKIIGISILSAFNKSLSGGGFGPIVTSGQIISGKNTRNSIGITLLTEGPICICGFLTYALLNGFVEPIFPTILILGAVAATPFGAFGIKKFNENKTRKFLGILMIILGTATILRIFL